MKPVFWLAWQELVSRKSAFVAGIVMVCVIISLCSATELVGRAREVAVSAQVDHMGPALRLIPSGKTAGDLARYELGSVVFASDYVDRLRGRLSPWIRAIEGRLLSKATVGRKAISVVGINARQTISPLETLGFLDAHKAALGVNLADELKLAKGDEIQIKNTKFNVIAVLPETASDADTALYISLRTMQDLFKIPDSVNEMRVYLKPGEDAGRVVSFLSANNPKLNVINMYRGEIAETGMNQSLFSHRRALYMITATVIALCILIWSYMNAGERRIEMATVVAVGGTSMTVLWMLIIRAAIVGFTGALVGYMTGSLIALVQDFDSALRVVASWRLFVVIAGGTVLLSMFSATIVSVFYAFREHVVVLQE